MPGTGIGGATRQGCPVQVYCRTADTIPRREKRWSPYELGQLPPFCGSVDAINYEDQDGAETELYGGHDVGKTASLFEFSLCLSRPCLGKMVVFMYKWLENAVFFRRAGLCVVCPAAPTVGETLLLVVWMIMMMQQAAAACRRL